MWSYQLDDTAMQWDGEHGIHGAGRLFLEQRGVIHKQLDLLYRWERGCRHLYVKFPSCGQRNADGEILLFLMLAIAKFSIGLVIYPTRRF